MNNQFVCESIWPAGGISLWSIHELWGKELSKCFTLFYSYKSKSELHIIISIITYSFYSSVTFLNKCRDRNGFREIVLVTYIYLNLHLQLKMWLNKQSLFYLGAVFSSLSLHNRDVSVRVQKHCVAAGWPQVLISIYVMVSYHICNLLLCLFPFLLSELVPDALQMKLLFSLTLSASLG